MNIEGLEHQILLTNSALIRIMDYCIKKQWNEHPQTLDDTFVFDILFRVGYFRKINPYLRASIYARASQCEVTWKGLWLRFLLEKNLV